ncbi:CBS domain-containing protein [Sneathiella glossodoripedis]|uniref:CBS domain-containing protein n=1 Tax=Sneathiella glossodoripedis TaxID=418853 RepID=UPI000470CB59|nr:CBS domain-containing protein [Sneathiella glossodoripedis]
MNVASILKGKGENIITADADDSIAAVAAQLNEHGIGAILVTNDANEVLGVVSERDIVRELARSGGGCLDMKASALMTTNVITCAPSDTIDDVMSLMTTKRIRHLPVMKGGKLCGFISIGDVVKNRIDEVEREAAAMRDYIATG